MKRIYSRSRRHERIVSNRLHSITQTSTHKVMTGKRKGKYRNLNIMRCEICEKKFWGDRRYRGRKLCWNHFFKEYGKHKPIYCRDLTTKENEELKREYEAQGIVIYNENDKKK